MKKLIFMAILALLFTGCIIDKETIMDIIDENTSDNTVPTPEPVPVPTPEPVPVPTPEPVQTVTSTEAGKYYGTTNDGRNTWYFSKLMKEYPRTFNIVIPTCKIMNVVNNGSRFADANNDYVLKQSEVPGRMMGLIVPLSCKSKIAIIEFTD